MRIKLWSDTETFDIYRPDYTLVLHLLGEKKWLELCQYQSRLSAILQQYLSLKTDLNKAVLSNEKDILSSKCKTLVDMLLDTQAKQSVIINQMRQRRVFMSVLLGSQHDSQLGSGASTEQRLCHLSHTLPANIVRDVARKCHVGVDTATLALDGHSEEVGVQTLTPTRCDTAVWTSPAREYETSAAGSGDEELSDMEHLEEMLEHQVEEEFTDEIGDGCRRAQDGVRIDCQNVTDGRPPTRHSLRKTSAMLAQSVQILQETLQSKPPSTNKASVSSNTPYASNRKSSRTTSTTPSSTKPARTLPTRSGSKLAPTTGTDKSMSVSKPVTRTPMLRLAKTPLAKSTSTETKGSISKTVSVSKKRGVTRSMNSSTNAHTSADGTDSGGESKSVLKKGSAKSKHCLSNRADDENDSPSNIQLLNKQAVLQLHDISDELINNNSADYKSSHMQALDLQESLNTDKVKRTRNSESTDSSAFSKRIKLDKSEKTGSDTVCCICECSNQNLDTGSTHEQLTACSRCDRVFHRSCVSMRASFGASTTVCGLCACQSAADKSSSVPKTSISDDDYFKLMDDMNELDSAAQQH